MLASILLGLTVLAAGEPQIESLQAGMSVWDVTAADVNGDGLMDILAVCCDETSKPLNKQLDVFLAKSAGTYDVKPSIVAPLDPDTGVLMTAETDGKPPIEVIAADAERFEVMGFRDGKMQALQEIKADTLIPSGSRQPTFLKGAAMDFNGDGVDEWLAPIPTGFMVCGLSGPLARIRCDVDSDVATVGGMRITARYPAFMAFTLPGETQKALAFLSDERADFAHGKDWKETTHFKVPINLGDKWDTSSSLHDINGDGLPDLVVTQTQGTINMKALTQVYIASGPMTYPDKPTASFESKGSFSAPILKDVNGDKKLDMLFISIPFGLKFFMNYFMFSQVNVDLQIYLFNGTGFAAKPDYTTSVTVAAPDGKEQNAYVLGDFNGDGNTDATFGAGANKLLFYAGGDVKFIASKPYLALNVNSFGVAKAFKLNTNASEDIVIFHPGITGKDHIEVIVF